MVHDNAVSKILAESGVRTTVISDVRAFPPVSRAFTHRRIAVHPRRLSRRGGAWLQGHQGAYWIRSLETLIDFTWCEQEVSKQKAKPPKQAWDPSARGKSRAKAGEITETVEDILPVGQGICTLLKSMGIPPDVKLADLIAPSGYEGREGLEKLVQQLKKLEKRDCERRVAQILHTYKDRLLR